MIFYYGVWINKLDTSLKYDYNSVHSNGKVSEII